MAVVVKEVEHLQKHEAPEFQTESFGQETGRAARGYSHFLSVNLMLLSFILASCKGTEPSLKTIDTQQGKEPATMTTKEESIAVRYELSGGGSVQVFKPFGPGTYAAVAEVFGEYPEQGKLACNFAREEFVVVLDGALQITRNDQVHSLKRDDHITFKPGDCYLISGSGRCLIVIQDQPGGRTDVIDNKQGK